MRILQINKFFWMKGGSETAFFSTIKLLEEHQHEVIPFAMKDARNIDSPYAPFFVDHVDYSSGGKLEKIKSALKIIYSFEARKKLSLLLNDKKPDIAHLHLIYHQISPSVLGPLRNRKIPVVMTVHDLKLMCPNYKMLLDGRVCEKCKERQYYHCLLNRCAKGSLLNSAVNTVEMYLHDALGFYRHIDAFIAPSRFMRDKMIEYGYPAQKIFHIPNFIDTDSFPLSSVDAGYGLYFGRLIEEKGIYTLLSALERCRDIPFLIVGTGPLEEELKAKVAALGLDKVTFCGFKSGQELKDLISNCSFTVICSECYENCPMAVLESLSMGKPVIGSRIGGIPELIDEGQDGYTYTTGDADDLAHKMTVLWGDNAGRKTMAADARSKIDSRYTPQKHYESLETLYKKTISRD